MPKKRTAKVATNTPLVLTSPAANEKKKSAKRSLSNKKNSHRRVRDTPMAATLRMVDGVGFVLDVDDVLTKNERYRLVSIPLGRGKSRASTVESELADEFKDVVKRAAVKCHMSCLHTPMVRVGLWRLEVLSIWPTERHHTDGTDTANGDSDAPIAMVKDAMQHAGIIDDDMRIVGETTHAVYRKGERRTVAVLRMVSAGSHADGVAAMLRLGAGDVLG